jgi:hypothetical protein
MSELFIFNLNKLSKILEPIDKHIPIIQGDCNVLSNVFKNFVILGPTSSTVGGLIADDIDYLTKMAKYSFEAKYGDAHEIACVLGPRYIGDSLLLYISERIEEIIYNHYFENKEPLAERKAHIYQDYNHFEPGTSGKSRGTRSSTQAVSMDEPDPAILGFICARLELPYLALQVFAGCII